MKNSHDSNFIILKGLTLVSIERNDRDGEGDELVIKTTLGRIFRLYHDQVGCETVKIEEIVGDLNNLIGAPILNAVEEIEEDNFEDSWDSWTKTTFTLSTLKDTVIIRWLGKSNGYYLESVSFVEDTI